MMARPQGAKVPARRGRPSPVAVALQGDRGDRSVLRIIARRRGPARSRCSLCAPACVRVPDQLIDHLDIPFEQLLIYEDDQLVFDGSDPSSYVVCHTAGDIRRALAAELTDDPGDDR
jgi:hypothetical protein